MQLQTSVGWIELMVCHGEDPQDGHWGCPIREHWGLRPHQKMSPTLEDRLAFTATMTSSYEKVSRLSEKWGYKVDDCAIHRLVQRLGKKAEEQIQKRLKELPQESEPQRAPSELGVLMVDGWYARFRGPGWGKKKTKKDRVKWHEIKTGIFYRQEQAGRTEGGRGVISEKAVVRWEKGPLELGRRLHWEALRQGLGRAKEMLVLGDGSKWIWNLAKDRWQDAYQGLDFYHGCQHLWELGRAVCGNEKATGPWVKQRLHRLRHGQHTAVLKEIAGLETPRGERGKIVRKERNYFARQKARMNYKELADRGWPIGSGAVESECNQDQGRFKRSGQFWTRPGFRHLSAIDEARRNDHWDELWLTA
jgi:hypothetical protein